MSRPLQSTGRANLAPQLSGRAVGWGQSDVQDFEVVSKKHIPDVNAVLARRHENGSDYWASVDGRLGVDRRRPDEPSSTP